MARAISPGPRRAVPPLEEHVLVQVGEAFLAWQLVGAAHAHPHLKSRHGRRVVLLDEDGQSVGQAVAQGLVSTSGEEEGQSRAASPALRAG